MGDFGGEFEPEGTAEIQDELTSELNNKINENNNRNADSSDSDEPIHSVATNLVQHDYSGNRFNIEDEQHEDSEIFTRPPRTFYSSSQIYRSNNRSPWSDLEEPSDEESRN